MPDMPNPIAPEKPMMPEANEPPDMLSAADTAAEQPAVAPERKPEQQAEKKSELVYQKILTQVAQAPAPATPADDAAAELDAKAIMAVGDAGEQVRKLIDFAMQKGITHAVAVARKLDFYVLDEMQGRMADEFYDALVAKGMITKE